MSDIRAWLDGLGLGEYAEAFEAESIALDHLRDLTETDLKELGLPMGPRKAVLRATQALADEEPAIGPAKQELVVSRREAERRQITVMFCDLVGSTALSEALDPEDLHAVMDAYRAAATGVIEHYDGHVAQYLGDGLMVYFGWPTAHEDDAARAVRAGLDIVGAIATVAAPEPLAVRIGIATGPVVVGHGGDGQGDARLAVGETPNIAARVQGLANGGTVAVAEGTRRLLGGAFMLDDLGHHAVKGISGTLHVYRAVGEVAVESRFEAAHPAGLTPFVGREEEVGLLTARWRQASDGEGQVVLLCGEPGIGKSRITQVLRERLATEPHTRLRYQCSPYHSNSAFYPLITQLGRGAGFERDDSAETRLDKLEALLGEGTSQTGTADVGRAMPLIAAMLSLPTDRYPPLNLLPEKQKELTIEAFVDQALALAARQPVLMLLEDAQWLDPTTLEAFGALVDRCQGAAILLVITYRPEFTPPWSGYGHITIVTLNRLSRRQVHALVKHVTGGKALPDEMIDQIVTKTDGVPLFVEELTKTILESGMVKEADGSYVMSGPLTELAIPPTLQDSLMARLDRLAPVKEVAQIGACIGRMFSYELLASVSPLDDSGLREALEQLVASELVFQRGDPPEANYTFKHALVQDVAYQSLLKSRRGQLHGRIVVCLEERYPEIVRTEPEVLAHHCGMAGLSDKAADYLLTAGRNAVERSAWSEAVAHLRAGVALLDSKTASKERDRREAELQMVLANALIPTRGYTDEETGRAFQRLHTLSERLDDNHTRMAASFGLWVKHLLGGETESALRTALEALNFAKSAGHSGHLLIGHRMTGIPYCVLGKLTSARDHLEVAARLYDPEQHRNHAGISGTDPGAAVQTWLSLVLWLLGYPDRARATSEKAIEIAGQSDHPNTMAFVLWHLALLDYLRRDLGALTAMIPRVAAVADEHGLRFWQSILAPISALSRVETGETTGTVEELVNCLSQCRGDLPAFYVPSLEAGFARAYAKLGCAREALITIDEAIGRSQTIGAAFSMPFLHMIKGDCVLAGEPSNRKEAEQAYLAAIEIARRQGAKSWEIRASTALARLWKCQGETAEARNLLAPVYDWFTEGFDTADLKDAKALLEELS